MPEFTLPVDIGNRALQHLGVSRVGSLTATQKGAAEILFCYDKLRAAELRRNTWRFAIRNAVLRAVGIDTLLWTPPTWASGTSYVARQIVSYTPASDVYSGEAIIWQTDSDTSGTTTPDQTTIWHRYFGPIAVDLYDSTTTYRPGEIVVVPAAWSGATTYAKNATATGSNNTIYVSLVDSNLNHDPTTDGGTHWVAWASNGRSTTGWGETSAGTFVPLTYPGTTRFYLSLVEGNADNPLATGAQWLALNGTGAALQIVYPISAGPSTQTTTKNVFRLPHGFLRQVPSDPKVGINPALGAPAGPWATDWLFQGNYIVSRDPGPIMLRFCADVIDVPDMNPMFCEGLANIIADATCQTVTQSEAKKAEIMTDYRRIVGEARLVDAIEQGSQDPPEDDFITCRL